MARDVELVIRAKDAATGAIETIKDALKDLTGIQEDVGQSAQKTDTLLGQLGNQLKTLTREAQGLSALGKIATEIDKAGGAVGRLEQNIAKSVGEFDRLTDEVKQAEGVTRGLRDQAAGLAQALKQQEAATKAAKSAQTEANAELRKAERALAGLEGRLAKANKPSADLIKQVEAQRALVQGLRANQQQAVATYNAQKQAQDSTSRSLRDLNTQIKVSEREQTRLSTAAEKSAQSVERQQTSLTKAKTEFAQIQNIAGQASTALGGMAVNQDRVTAASARMAAELARTKTRIDALQAAPRAAASAVPSADTANLQAQRRALLETRREWTNAEAEVKRLGAAMRATAQPTEEMGQALGRAQAQARLAKQEYQQQRVALAQLAGSARSSFAAFSQANTQMQRSSVIAGAANRSLSVTANQAAASIRPIAPAATAAGTAMRGAATGANGMRTALAGIYGESRKALSLMQRIRGEVLSLTAGYLGLQAAISNIGGVITAFQTLEAAQNRLGAVFNQDTQRVGQELEWLERQAARLGIGFGTLAMQYSKFTVAADQANFASSATRDIFLSVAEAGRVNKLSVDQLNGIFLALEQMISKGTVMSEELRRQLGDRLPGAFNIMANALGVTTAELGKMMEAGEVLANQETMLKFAAELDKRFGSQLADSLRSTTTEIGRWENSIYQAQLRVAEGGFIEGFTEALRNLNEYFSSREGRDFFLSVGAALGRFAMGLASLPQYFDEIQLAISAFVGFKLAQVFTGIIASIRQTQGSLTGATASFFTWQGTVTAARNAMTAFTASAAPVNGVLATMRAQLLGVSTAAGIAGRSFVAVQASLLVLRGAAVAVTGAFRLMWTAIGGLPGLILTGITFALGSWLTSVDDTTQAIDEHRRIMGEVIGAYEEVKDKTDDWAKSIKNVTLDQANANVRLMIERLDEARQKIADFAERAAGLRIGEGSPEWVKQGVQMRDLAQAFAEGKKNASEMLDELIEIYATVDNPDLQRFGEELLAIAREAARAEQDLGGAAVAANSLGNTSDEVREIMDRLGITILDLIEVVDDSADSFSKSEERAKQFRDSLDGINKLIPSLATELKRLGEIDSLNKLYKDGVNAARTMSEIVGLTQQYNRARAEMNAGAVEGAVSGSLVDRIIGIESNGNPNAKNPNSSATGLGQFIESTWLRMFKQYFPDRAAGMSNAMILELRKNADISRQMVELYVRENSKILQEAGVAITDANLYLAHFLGPGVATKLLSAPAGTPVSSVLGADQINANQSILGGGKSVEEVVAWAERKVGVSNQELAIQKSIVDEEQKRVDKIEDFQQAFDQRLSDQQFELEISKLSNREQEIQRALREENNRAIQAGTELTDAQKQRIMETTGALFDQKNSRDALTASEERVNQLYALRQQLLEQLKMAEESGDYTQVENLRLRITDVNNQLLQAIPAAIAMWQAIGGPEADAAIAKLQTTAMSIANVGQKVGFLGLNMQQWGELAGSFADGLIGVFDTFAQAVANGENAIEAMGKAFLQFAADFMRQIAQMILKQLIFNALRSFFPGLPLPTGHTGGIVGSSAIGGGNMRKSVSPAIFAGAMRYHTGGVAGLRPDEVPAVLRKGEEVLTEADPRHRMNGGMAPASAPSAQQSIRNIVVLDEESAANWMSSATGEKVVMSLLRKNAPTLRTIIG
jgi:tape measure domain-containing protein